MTPILWHNATIATPQGWLKDGWLLTGGDEDGDGGRGGRVGNGNRKIRGFGSSRPDAGNVTTIDLQGGLVLPGLIDVHVHGGGGFQAMAASRSELDGMSRFHAAHGTTAFLATTETAAPERIERALHEIGRAAAEGVSGAELLGAHLEGPFLNAMRAGAQNKAHIVLPTEGLIERFLSAGDGCIRLVTLAPELPGGLAAVSRFANAGVTVSAGHTDASFEQMEEAVRHGVTHMTHHFNGMRPVHHREPGAAGAGLLLPDLTVELIADGIHVHPGMIRLAFRMKPVAQICMITDAILCAGLPDGEYANSVVMENGRIYSRDRSTLAGSSLTMISALRNAMRFTEMPLLQLLPAFTSVPARQAGVGARKGTLEAGKDADFIVVDAECELQMTVVGGRIVWEKDDAHAHSHKE